jgi:hypothetical protein
MITFNFLITTNYILALRTITARMLLATSEVRMMVMTAYKMLMMEPHMLVVLIGGALLTMTKSTLLAQSGVGPKQVLLATTPAPRGQIYLQLDRSVYAKGETVWFNAYLTASEGLSVGTTLQAELWKEDSLCMRLQFPVALGVTSGQFTLPANCSTGWYYIRSFTEQARLTPFQTSVYIIGKEAPPGSRIAPDNTLQISFYPEGGQLVEGIESHIAFMATDGNGLPVSLSGTIRNAKGDSITSFSTWHLGRGEFFLRPEPGQTYYAQWMEQGTIKRQPLTPIKTGGTVLSLIEHPEGFLFELSSTAKDPLKRGHLLRGTMEDREVFRQPLSTAVSNLQGILKTKQLLSGVLKIAVLDTFDRPVVTRSVFINNKEYSTTFSLRTDTLALTSKAKNKWMLQWPDSLRGSISVAVTDADLDGIYYGRSSVMSQLLLPAGINDKLLRPDWYFQTTADSAGIGLDLLLLTTPDNNAMAAAPVQNINNSPSKGYITISGQAVFRDTRQPLANAKMIVVLSAPRIRNNILFTETDQAGRFSIDSLLFFGAARLIFAEHRPQKKSRPIDIKLDHSSIPPLTAAAALQNQAFPVMPSPLPQGDAAWLQKMNELVREAEGITLEEVTIKTRIKSPLEKLQEEYTRGAFETDAFVERVIDLVNSDEATTYPNIFEYIRFRIPGLQVVDPDYSKSPPNPSQSGGFEMQNDPTKYRIFYRQLPSASGMGNPPMVIYLNEVEVDADVLLTIPTAEIALVKLFSSFAAAQGGGPGGALAIYTKKPELLKATNGNAVTFTGYTPIASFPERNYETDASLRDKPDGRVTLFWRSNLFLNGIESRMPIQFFNSDRTKRFRIVVEGITPSGRPLFFEKILE